MSSERWQQIEEIFEQVLDRSPGEQQACLEKACGEDSGLRQAVESLLDADRKGESFLKAPLIPSPTPAAPLPSGGQLGSYRLLREIGQGGMSTVFLAARDDDAFQRRVAIKIIRRGMESAEAQRRLRIERQILASLDHPWIARLYDGGSTDEGLPFFVMEYVEGLPIDAYCDQHQLTVEERTALFRKVCSAVHYAHQNLIVHRDIKPSNILVATDGVPKLLDFGIAKLLNPDLISSEAEPTATWMRMLTPHYASPEQIRGGTITTASDVYSLGVLLYKLLAGSMPYRLEGRTPQEVERLVSEEIPPKPSTAVSGSYLAKNRTSTPSPEQGAGGAVPPEAVGRARGVSIEQLSRQLDGDLDNIVMMALRSAPNRRYSSAEQMADDLERYTMGFPVMAREGGFSYRLGKFLRRHRWSLAAVAVILLLIVSFAVAMALQSARVARERDQARLDRDQKKQVLGLVEEVFRLADPGEARGESFTVREALDRSTESIERRLRDQPALEAALRETVGKIYLNLGLLDEAKTHLMKVVEIQRQLNGDESLEMSRSLSMLGAVFREMGEYDRAESLARQAVEVARRIVGDDHPDLIEPLNQLVTLYCYKGDYEAADEPSAEALTVARRHLGKSHSELAVAVNDRANVLKHQDQLELAESLYREGLKLQRIVVGNDHPEVANIINNLAVVAKARGNYAEAERLHRENLALRRKLYGDAHPAVAQSLNNLASVLRASGDTRGAEAAYREAAGLLQKTLGAGHPLTVRVVTSLADMLLDSGQAQPAAEWLQSRLSVLRAELAEGNPLIALAESALGESLSDLGNYPEAERLLAGSLPRIRGFYGERHPNTIATLSRLVELYQAWGKPEQASRYRTLLAGAEADSG